MSKEKIIELAREAGLSDLVDYNRMMHPDCFVGKWDDLVKLYQLVAAKERERIYAEQLGANTVEAIRAKGEA